MIEMMTRRALPGPRRLDRPDRPRLGGAARPRAPRARGALLVSGHFGQWEAVRAALKARGIEVGALLPAGEEPLAAARPTSSNVEAGGRRCSPRGRRAARARPPPARAAASWRCCSTSTTRRGAADRLPRPPGADRHRRSPSSRSSTDVPMIPVYGTAPARRPARRHRVRGADPADHRRGDDPGRRRQPRRPRPRPPRAVLLAAPPLGEAPLSGPSADRAIHAAPTATWKNPILTLKVHNVCTTSYAKEKSPDFRSARHQHPVVEIEQHLAAGTSPPRPCSAKAAPPGLRRHRPQPQRADPGRGRLGLVQHLRPGPDGVAGEAGIGVGAGVDRRRSPGRWRAR